MNMIRIVLSTLVASAATSLVAQVQAQTLDVTLTESDVTVSQGATEVNFFATVVSPSSNTGTIYLNGEGLSAASTYLTDPGLSSVFYTNAPLSLNPGTSSGPIDFFDVLLSSTTPAGTYNHNTFSILGGYGAFDGFNLSNTSFAVTIQGVVTAAPEMDVSSSIAALTLLAGGLAVLRGRRNVGIAG
jgi:hypothetical protein